MDNPNKKPCLVKTPQGFSVSYNNKLLYSKYNPQRSILQQIENLEIKPGTILLCCSPVLEYGLNELKEKLPENCLIICCEFNSELLEFTKTNNPEFSNFIFPEIDELYQLPVILNSQNYSFKNGFIFENCSKYRRVIKLDFSSGVSECPQMYNQLAQACTNGIMTFWSNRITLTKFGRLYSKNFFANLKHLSETKPIQNYFGKIEKPVVIFGAGESLEKGAETLKKNHQDFYILCADTALQALQKYNIHVDGVFIEEAQSVILQAFRGSLSGNYTVFAGLSSVTTLLHLIPASRISFFTTKYTQGQFLNELTQLQLLPPENNAFGSVGLTLFYYALKFRKDESVPVFAYGLDFSYSTGKTHSKGTYASDNLLYLSNRLKPGYNFNAAFLNNAGTITDAFGNTVTSTPVLHKYSVLFNEYFSQVKNAYSGTKSGLISVLPYKSPEEAFNSTKENHITSDSFSKDFETQLQNYFEKEKNALNEIKNILTGQTPIEESALEETLTFLIKKREYLYLHFADGYEYKYSQSFLNRIRTEIDFFLKVF